MGCSWTGARQTEGVSTRGLRSSAAGSGRKTDARRALAVANPTGPRRSAYAATNRSWSASRGPLRNQDNEIAVIERLFTMAGVCPRSSRDPKLELPLPHPRFTGSFWGMSLAPIRRANLVPVALALAACACGEAPPPSTSDSLPEDPDPPVAIPALGTAATFDVATWNIKHFGEPDDGPIDDRKQLRRVRDVILGIDADLWGVQEIADEVAFAALLAELPDYDGLLATDPLTGDGAAFYEDFAFERKVGLVYKREMVEILDARVVLTDLEFEFAGRPPLEARLRVTSQDITRDVIVVVLHTKSDDQVTSWERRAAGGAGLKAYLDAAWPDDPVLVLGDWNDDVVTSITPGRDSPYRPFVDDATSWIFVSAPLTAAGQTSIIGYPNVIDHILASDEAVAWYQPESVLVYRVDEFIPDYANTTSDHLPVVARFVLER